MLLEQIKKGENKKLELKEKLPSGEAIAKTVVAFSNTSGGKLVIRVNKNREVVGIDERKIFDYEEKITSIINKKFMISAKKWRKSGEKTLNLTVQEEIVYNFVLENGKVSLKNTMELLNIKATRAREILSGLVKKGIFEKIGKTKGSYYILKE